ncbi:MFS transporter [Allobaculum fili]|uniref:MFS transporter n=1 Tax=Allobaculum fili TaxID=2834460 RepID=UPI001E480F69|nr:MFS transporter [Allobaculum fili]
MVKKDHLAYLKVLISTCLMVGASIGLCFYSAGAFYSPLSGGLGISLGQASASTTWMLVFMALSALAVPFLLRKLRLLDLLLIGTALCAGSVLMIAFSVNVAWVYIFSAITGIGAALIGMVPASTIVQNWFVKHRAGATSIALAGSALVAALFSSVFSFSISMFGWRMGFVLEAVLILVLMLPALLWKIDLTPAQAGMQPYGHEQGIPAEPDARKLSNSVLWTFALIAILSAILIGLPMHFSSLAASIGRTTLLGASMLTYAMLGNLVFKLVGGWLSNRLQPVWTIAILDLCSLIASIGILICILSGASDALSWLAFFLGSVFALSELSLPLLVSANAARRHFSAFYAVLNCLSTMTTALSIMVIGYMYDGLHSYVWMYVLAIAAEVLILFLLWLLIRSAKNDDLVTNATTRSLVLKLRDWENKYRSERSRKAQERRRKEEEQKAYDEEMKRQDTPSAMRAHVVASSIVVPSEKETEKENALEAEHEAKEAAEVNPFEEPADAKENEPVDAEYVEHEGAAPDEHSHTEDEEKSKPSAKPADENASDPATEENAAPADASRSEDEKKD